MCKWPWLKHPPPSPLWAWECIVLSKVGMFRNKGRVQGWAGISFPVCFRNSAGKAISCRTLTCPTQLLELGYLQHNSHTTFTHTNEQQNRKTWKRGYSKPSSNNIPGVIVDILHKYKQAPFMGIYLHFNFKHQVFHDCPSPCDLCCSRWIEIDRGFLD